MRKLIITSFILFVVIISICICAFAEDITGLQTESNELTEQINEANNQLKAVQDKLSKEMEELQQLDEQIAQSQTEYDNINTQVEDLMKQIEENEEKLDKTQKEFDNLQSLLDERLLATYKTPRLGYLQTILTADSITDMLSKYYNLKQLMEYDQKLIETVKQQKQEIETTKQILADKKKQVVADKQTQQKKAQVLSNTKKTREYYLSKLTDEERQLQSKIDEYNLQVAEIEAEIKMLALNSISSDYIGGAMLWPVPGHTKLTSLYGMRVHPITGAYKLHTGIDISAPLGTSFIAAANGIVTKATYNTAYGNMVIIDHGGGVQTLYAHGDQILVQLGQTVSAGTEVLKVGSTGYSTGPHAHFEIRINGQTVNPLNYLLDLSKDENTNNTEENTEQTPENVNTTNE
mgnify:FL=1